MNIRSIIGLTAIAPYIIGSSLLLSTACAPKSRYRGPVNVAGVGPVLSKEQKAAVQDDTEARMKEIDAELAASPEKKAETSKLSELIQGIDIETDGSKAIVILSLKDDKGVEIAGYDGPITDGQVSELKMNEDAKTDIKVSLKCVPQAECKVIDVIVKKGIASIEYRVASGPSSAAITKVEVQPEAAGDTSAKDDPIMISKLYQINTAKMTTVLNMVSKQESLLVEINQELEDKSIIELNLKGSSEVGPNGSLSIVGNSGLERLTQAKLISKAGKLTDKESSMEIEISSEGETPFKASLKLGKEAADFQKAITEAKLKSEEDKKAADAKKADDEKKAAEQKAGSETPAATSGEDTFDKITIE